ncbi:MAG: archease [Thermoanaerobaculia bacterium]
MGFRFLDHTADLAVEVTAPTIPGLFAEAARAFADCITDVDALEPRQRLNVQLAAGDLDELLVEFLGELLFRFEGGGFLPCRALMSLDGDSETGWTLQARLEGEPFDLDRHPYRTQIKGITWHGLVLERRDDETWHAVIVLDV